VTSIGEDDRQLLRDPAARAARMPSVAFEAARAALAAAGEAVARAALDVERTRIRVPFDSLVLSESVDVGQLVSAQHVIAELAGTQAYRIEAALPVADLAWLPPLDAAGTNGVPCRITQDMGNGARLERRGFVTHVLGDLDPAGRLARVLVEVPDPAGQDLPGRLLLGAYVNVRIDGRRLDGVFVLRERWIHEGGRVWIKGPDNRLEFRTVRVLRRQDGDAFVDQGLDAGVTVVTGRIPVPVPGMLLKSAGPARAAGAPE
ncbi:MAG: HlyD family efflux transporter periplasmic adaptor subunit, partial [Lentisphaerae bacterium]|nr:HlyD family efflux transporter periplasmic adaptor subunit [Lentisphaerota bacterium]